MSSTGGEGAIWLSDDDVQALLDPAALVDAIAAGFASLGAGTMLEPPSATMAGLDGRTSYLTTFPAHHRGSGYSSVKLLAGRPENALEGRPEIDAVVALSQAATGRILALMAARRLTALRTAAVTAVALRVIAGPEPRTIGLLGTGMQAIAHAQVFAAAGLASGFRVASPRQGPARAAAFAAEAAGITGIPVEPVSPESIAAACEALVTMTLARRPLALGPLPDDFAIACVGPFLPDAHEIDPLLLAGAALVVSDHPARLARQWSESALVDIGRVAPAALADWIGIAAPPRRGLRLFLSDGRGFEDNIAATLVYEAARRVGRGLALP